MRRNREAGGVEYDWVMIVANPLICFTLFSVCMCVSKLSDMTRINRFFASKSVWRELSVLLTTAEILNV